MTRLLGYFRKSVSAAVAACALVVGVVAFVWACAALETRSLQLDRESRVAIDTAQQLRQQCVPLAETRRIEALRADMDRRFSELRSPAAMVAGLSESCRKCGTTVLSITPVDRQQNVFTATAPVTHRYRLVVAGGYRQVAALIDGSAKLRLPARVVEFNISPEVTDQRPAARLVADIVVECFEPPAAIGGNA